MAFMTFEINCFKKKVFFFNFSSFVYLLPSLVYYGLHMTLRSSMQVNGVQNRMFLKYLF